MVIPIWFSEYEKSIFLNRIMKKLKKLGFKSYVDMDLINDRLVLVINNIEPRDITRNIYINKHNS